jgi:hypothetical protein
MKKLSRDQGALDTPILSQDTNQARRGSRKRPGISGLPRNRNVTVTESYSLTVAESAYGA